MLVDQPLIPVGHLQAILVQAGKAPHEPLCTRANGRRMAPAYLPRSLWPKVFQLDGDRGAGGILNAAGASCRACDVAAQDIDTRADLFAAQRFERAGG